MTILAVAFEPFVQNVIRYHPQPVPSATEPAFLANVSFYDYSGQNYSWHTAAHPLLRTNVENAMYYFDKPELWAQPSYTCRTGDCTWGFVSTVTVRSECSDVSDKLVYSQVPMRDPAVFGYTKSVSFPGGPRIQYQEADGSGIPMGSVMYVQAITGDIPPWGIRSIEPRGNVDFAENMSWLGHSKVSFIGTECTLVPCIRSFRAIVSNGAYREEDVEEWCNGNSTGGNFPTWQIQHPEWGPERGFWPGEIYGIGRNGFRGIDDFFHSSFNGYMDVEAPAVRFVPVQDGSVEGGGVQILRGMFTRKFASTECENTTHKINCSFANLATAITKSIRDAPYAEHGWESANMARGQTLVSVQYVEVRWSWLMLPILVWTLSTVAYVGTAWETRRAKLQPWGSNPLPLLFLYEDTDSKRGLHGGTSEAAFVERSENIKVRLHVSETEARLVDA